MGQQGAKKMDTTNLGICILKDTLVKNVFAVRHYRPYIITINFINITININKTKIDHDYHIEFRPIIFKKDDSNHKK